MNGYRLTLGCMIAVVCATAFMTFSTTAEAQVRVIERDTDGFTVRIESGARLRHLAHAIGMEPDMDQIARSNPGHIIYVCRDNMPGERPYMSRDPESWNACQHFSRERWLLAGVTYYVPLRFESAPVASDAPPAESLWREEGLRSHNRLLERRITELETDLETAHNALIEADDRADEAAASTALLRDSNARLESDMTGMGWLAALFSLLFLLMGFGALYVLWRTRLMLRRIMDSARRERVAWSQYADKMRRNRDEIIGTLTSKVSSLNSQIEMLKRNISETSNELAQTQTQQGRLRRRTNLLLVQLAKYRKLLRQCYSAIQHFQRRLSEETAHRERLPTLLKSVDDARLQLIYANNARARVDMVRRWLMYVYSRRRTMAPTMRKITVLAYLGVIAQYRKQQREFEQKARELEPAKLEAIETIYKLTGIRADHLDPESRLKRSMEAADKNAELLDSQTQALNELIQIQIRLQGEFDAREKGIESREEQLGKAEAEYVERLHKQGLREREHAAQVDAWNKELELKKEIDAWSGAALKAETTGKLSDVERRMSEMEGRMNGYERRAISAEKDLDETNDFLEVARKEFKAAKELIEGIKKGPNFLEARTAQMAEYISQLEEKLGIERKSIWAGLPDLAYGSVPPKAKA
ncbi:hypothetical protein IPH19_03655 [Candidatus Uhrbacteria bacterium]|nr:MAG: hypothetical protein IPH19_03655 [Candidatus Uhrbacteria bacterium]